MNRRQILKTIFKLLKEAQKSDGFFFTLTIKNNTTLTHYEQHDKFSIADFEPSLVKVAELINDQYPETCLKILNKLLPSAFPVTTITRANG